LIIAPRAVARRGRSGSSCSACAIRKDYRLADVLELQPISLVRLLDRLVEHGLVERRSDPKDRRANRLFVTAAGRKLADDLDSLRNEIATDVLQDLPTAAIQTSLKTLRDIKERIKTLAEPSGNVAAK
jgi:MarR family transcriptional regulator, transcriptional regulator for hemolysin